MEQIQNEMKRLQRQHRAEERKARDRRIFKRGAHLESLLPDTIGLSDVRFFTFLERTVANKFGRDALDKLKAEQDKEDAAIAAEKMAEADDAPATVAAAQDSVAPALKSAASNIDNIESDAANLAQASASPDSVDGGRTENSEKQGA